MTKLMQSINHLNNYFKKLKKYKKGNGRKYNRLTAVVVYFY